MKELLLAAAKLAGIDQSELEGLVSEVEKSLASRRDDERSLLDVYEHIALLRGVADERWERFAKALILLRIYSECGRSLRSLSTLSLMLVIKRLDYSTQGIYFVMRAVK